MYDVIDCYYIIGHYYIFGFNWDHVEQAGCLFPTFPSEGLYSSLPPLTSPAQKKSTKAFPLEG